MSPLPLARAGQATTSPRAGPTRRLPTVTEVNENNRRHVSAPSAAYSIDGTSLSIRPLGFLPMSGERNGLGAAPPNDPISRTRVLRPALPNRQRLPGPEDTFHKVIIKVLPP